MKTAVFPGSFDPITLGHESIIKRAIPLFDHIIIAIGINADKTTYFSLEKRLKWLNTIFADCPTISVENYHGLTVDFCRQRNANYIIRGLRTSSDFEFERSVGQVNRKLDQQIETVFFLALPEHVMVTSSIVREIHKFAGDISGFISPKIEIYEK